MKTPRHRLYRVYLNSQGYDNHGSYWGIDKPLFCHETPDGLLTQHYRAPTRSVAKQLIRVVFPDAEFYR